jgi:hypothetical protein
MMEVSKQFGDSRQSTETNPMDATSHPAVLAIAAAVADAANVLRVPIDQTVVDYVEARDWRDSCLELPNDNDACADVMTPGYLIVLGDGFHYRSDRQGNVHREPEQVDTEVRVYFKQAGGIAGWISEYFTDSSTLPAADAEQLRHLIEASDFFHLPEESGNGTPIADGYRFAVFLAVGRRNHTVETYDGSGPADSLALWELITWLKQRAPAPQPRPNA